MLGSRRLSSSWESRAFLRVSFAFFIFFRFVSCSVSFYFSFFALGWVLFQMRGFLFPFFYCTFLHFYILFCLFFYLLRRAFFAVYSFPYEKWFFPLASLVFLPFYFDFVLPRFSFMWGLFFLLCFRGWALRKGHVLIRIFRALSTSFPRRKVQRGEKLGTYQMASFAGNLDCHYRITCFF